MHSNEDVWVYTEVSPVDVPIARVIVTLYFPVELVSDFGNNRILGH